MQFKKHFIFAAVVALFSTACKEKTSAPQVVFDRGALLQNIGNEIILPSYAEATVAAENFSLQVQQFAANTTLAELQKTQQSFLAAYKNWQLINLFEIGEAANIGLRVRMNTYPTNVQKINDAIAQGSWNFNALTYADAIGFPAVDFLLFAEDENQTLALFTTDAHAQKRMQLCADLAADIHQKIEQVYNHWKPTGGNYMADFTTKTGTDAGSGLSLLVNALNQHYERFFRDGKIGIPVGIRSLGIAIPENCEAIYSGVSHQLVLENFDAIKRLYFGDDLNGNQGVGLDDHLREIGAENVDEQIVLQLQKAEDALLLLSDPLAENIKNNQAQVEAAYAELQKLIVLFKVDMPSRLGVLITYQDNDGD